MWSWVDLVVYWFVEYRPRSQRCALQGTTSWKGPVPPWGGKVLLEPDVGPSSIIRGGRNGRPRRGVSREVESDVAGRKRSIAAWGFSPHHSVEFRPAEAEGFHRSLRSALRTAHGLNVALSLELRSGAGPRLRLTAANPVTARWMGRVLIPVYRPSQWVAEPRIGIDRTFSPTYVARRRYEWPEPLGLVAPGESTLDSWTSALSTAPVGIVLRWQWTSRSPTVSHWWDPPPARPSFLPEQPRSGRSLHREPTLRGAEPDSDLAAPLRDASTLGRVRERTCDHGSARNPLRSGSRGSFRARERHRLPAAVAVGSSCPILGRGNDPLRRRMGAGVALGRVPGVWRSGTLRTGCLDPPVGQGPHRPSSRTEIRSGPGSTSRRTRGNRHGQEFPSCGGRASGV